MTATPNRLPAPPPIEGIDASAWTRLVTLLLKAIGTELTLHDVAVSLGVSTHLALAAVLYLQRHNLVSLKYYVCHSCSKLPVAYRDFKEGFQPTPWACPACDEKVGWPPNVLTYDLRCLVRADWAV